MRQPIAGEDICKNCLARVRRYIYGHLEELDLVVKLTCARCEVEFIGKRWRKPAYCGDACKQAAYRERYKRSAA